jgi:methylglutamate dehydrogenase subunit A
MSLPESIEYCIIGGGVNGLSTAWHLARRLKETGRGDGSRIVVLEKSDTGAGASGIACGVVRNFYFSPAMCELVKLSVEVWEEEPEALAYNPVGYIAAVPKQQVGDLEQIFQRQREIGYESDLFLGEDACSRHMKTMFSDFHCEGIEGVLHEHDGGFSTPRRAIQGLTRKVEQHHVRLCRGVEVTGFNLERGVVKAVRTTHGTIRPELVVIAAGPWTKQFWQMLELPATAHLRAPNGEIFTKPMFTYWKLREGSIRTDRPYLQDDNQPGPVIHLDHSIPLIHPDTNQQVHPGPWGIYWKQDATGVQGGGLPIPLGEDVEIEPYGRANQELDAEFQRYFGAGLAWAMERFRGSGHAADVARPNGGIGCFTPDNYPIIDMVNLNTFFIADSNHGFKMLGAGKEVAAQILDGPRRSLRPFRLSRFEEGDLHPSSHSPFPWN